MSKYSAPQHLIRFGLALVFLANSLTAFFVPSEFIELIEKSFLSNLLPINIGVFIIIIGINDALVSIFLLSNKYVRWVALWAVIWIIGVIMMRGEFLGTLEEAGFLFMAAALTISKKYNN